MLPLVVPVTVIRAADAVVMAFASGTAAAGAVEVMDVSGWVRVLLPPAIAAAAGVFTAWWRADRNAVAMRVELQALTLEVQKLSAALAVSEGRVRDEMQTYYQRRGDK